MQNIIKETNNYIKFYISKNEGKKIDKIYITGDIVLIEGIESMIEKALNIETHKGFNKLIDLKVEKRKEDFSESFYSENFYNGNIGVLLREE
jgi:Tfp pilus assembly PilM family ATPase